MIYTKKAFFLFAITFAGRLCAITHAEREALLAEAAEKQALLRELVEKIFAQDALIQSYTERAGAKISAIATLEEKMFGISAKETYEKTTQEIKDFFAKSPIKNPITLSEECLLESNPISGKVLIKIYTTQAAIYEFIILFNLIQEWELTANSLNQILIKLDHPVTR